MTKRRKTVWVTRDRDWTGLWLEGGPKAIYEVELSDE